VQSTLPKFEVPAIAVPAEELLRAQGYRLLAGLLSRPVDEAQLGVTGRLLGDESQLGQAVSRMAAAARVTNITSLADAYHDLFVGLGRGLLVPFASYYLTGFLQEKPLAKLRGDMERLGIARPASATEPEDHIASVLDMMAGVIDGTFGDGEDFGEQTRFFKTHVGSWAGYFFRDLEASERSPFYAALGAAGSAFIEIEESGFALA
jgi:TorA maturation chaperone TorD